MIHGCLEPRLGPGGCSDHGRRMAASKPTEIKIIYPHPDQPRGRFTATLLLPASRPIPSPAQETPRIGHPQEALGKRLARKGEEREKRGVEIIINTRADSP